MPPKTERKIYEVVHKQFTISEFQKVRADALLILENPCLTWFPWLFAVGFSVVPAFCFSCRFRFVFAYFRRFFFCRGYFIGFDILGG
jgi:hypothetical protein